MDFQYENTFSTVKNEHIINEQILVVEDDYINRFYIQKIFEKNNYQAEYVEDGIYVEDVLRKNSFGLVLMDLNLPVMDGFSCADRINYMISLNMIKPLRIVAITAYSIEYTKYKCLSYGFCDYISKPFLENELIFTINYWLQPLFNN